MNNHCKQIDFFLGALVGGAIGSLSVMLFTTKKGKQLQRHIGDACENVKDTFFEAKEKVEDMAHDAVDSAEHLGKKAIHKVKHEIHDK